MRDIKLKKVKREMSLNNCYFLTAKAGEQLCTKVNKAGIYVEDEKQNDFMNDYVSSDAATPSQNEAIRYNQLAFISLTHSNVLNGYNSYMKQNKLSAA